VTHNGESDMRCVPALQAADLLAYCVGRKNDIRFGWQRKVVEIERIEEWLDYSELSKPLLDIVDLAKNKWKLPRRRATR
jgi:hypothetical protein